VRGSLSRFLTRQTVIELTAAVAVGLAFVYAVQAVVSGLIVAPIQEGTGPNDFPLRTGYVAIWHRLFNWLDPLTAVAVLGIVLAVVGVAVHRTREFLVDDDGYVECPH
jgi:large-conductance mechanosensitive channel